MKSHYPENFGSHRHCGCGYMMFLVVVVKIPHALASIHYYCLYLKHMACHARAH